MLGRLQASSEKAFSVCDLIDALGCPSMEGIPECVLSYGIGIVEAKLAQESLGQSIEVEHCLVLGKPKRPLCTGPKPRVRREGQKMEPLTIYKHRMTGP